MYGKMILSLLIQNAITASHNNESLNIHMNIFKTGVVEFWIDKLDTAAIS